MSLQISNTRSELLIVPGSVISTYARKFHQNTNKKFKYARSKSKCQIKISRQIECHGLSQIATKIRGNLLVNMIVSTTCDKTVQLVLIRNRMTIYKHNGSSSHERGVGHTFVREKVS